MIDTIKNILPEKVKWRIRNSITRLQSVKRQKIFGIGLNKTGTTSLKTAMDELDYVVGHQPSAELLMDDWAKRDFSSIVSYCKTAQFFQDVPFSKPYTFVVLDHEFPNSKFILTVRDTAEQWYNSLTKFHAKKWGKEGRIPTKEDLQKAPYIYEGWAWKINRMSYHTPENEPYKKDVMLNFYKGYNASVKEYFRHRPEDLLVLNVAENGSYQKLCEFLGVNSERDDFPWKNKTKEVK